MKKIMYFYLITIIVTVITTAIIIPYIKKQSRIKELESKIEKLDNQIKNFKY